MLGLNACLLRFASEAFTLAGQGGFLASLAMVAGLTMTVLCCDGSFEPGWATKINQLINKINRINKKRLHKPFFH